MVSITQPPGDPQPPFPSTNPSSRATFPPLSSRIPSAVERGWARDLKGRLLLGPSPSLGGGFGMTTHAASIFQ
jgi:hypothetical protein